MMELMSKPEHEELLDAARELSDAATVVSRSADVQRRAAVLAAVEAGMSKSEIARRLGLTPTRVNQIIQNTR